MTLLATLAAICISNGVKDTNFCTDSYMSNYRLSVEKGLSAEMAHKHTMNNVNDQSRQQVQLQFTDDFMRICNELAGGKLSTDQAQQQINTTFAGNGYEIQADELCEDELNQ